MKGLVRTGSGFSIDLLLIYNVTGFTINPCYYKFSQSGFKNIGISVSNDREGTNAEECALIAYFAKHDQDTYYSCMDVPTMLGQGLQTEFSYSTGRFVRFTMIEDTWLRYFCIREIYVHALTTASAGAFWIIFSTLHLARNSYKKYKKFPWQPTCT